MPETVNLGRVNGRRIPRPNSLSMPALSPARRWLAVIVISAVAVRLGYILAFGGTLNLQTSGYDIYAVNLMAGNGYTRFPDFRPDSDLPPLYPAFLVGVYTVLGRSAASVALAQIALEVVTITTIYAIGRRVGGAWTGIVAAAFTAFYPYLLFQNLTLNDTAIFLTLLALAVLALYRTTERPTLARAALVGVVLGGAALTKTLCLALLPFAAVWWWRVLGWRQALRLSLVVGGVTLAVLTPWVARNIAVQGGFTLISTNDGSNLHQGNNPCVADYLLNGWDAQWVNCLPSPPEGLNELALSAWHRDQALRYIQEHLGAMPRLFAVKLWTLWSPEILPRAVPPDARLGDTAALQYEQPLFRAARIVHLLYFTPLLLLGGIGWWQAARRAARIAPILMVIAAITLAYLVFHPSTRYRAPADPFVFILAAYVLTDHRQPYTIVQGG